MSAELTWRALDEAGEARRAAIRLVFLSQTLAFSTQTIFWSCNMSQDDNLNPNSLEVLLGAKLEPSLANAKLEDRFQFERVGYFCLDPDSTPGKLVFNRTLPLKDSWAKIEKKSGA